MSLTYALADLHGRYDLLEAAIETITNHAGSSPATIVALGDYIDRGPDSQKVIERLRQWRIPHLRLIALKGNHEAMLCDVVHGRAEESWWRRQGGDATLRSYREARLYRCADANLGVQGEIALASKDLQQSEGQDGWSQSGVCVIPRVVIDWLDALPLIHVDSHRVFVHAGVDQSAPLDRQAARVLLWKRHRVSDRCGHGSHHVVHGHDGNLRGPILKRGRTNLDCLAWQSSILAVGVFSDDAPGGPKEILKILPRAPQGDH